MLESLVFIVGLIVFEVVAARFGKSTRDGEDWVQAQGPHLPVSA